MRAVCASLVLGSVALTGCASHKPASPYTVGAEEDRNPAKAASKTIGPQCGPASVRQIEAQTKQANRELRGLDGGG